MYVKHENKEDVKKVYSLKLKPSTIEYARTNKLRGVFQDFAEDYVVNHRNKKKKK